jgi:hypothetical protein
VPTITPSHLRDAAALTHAADAIPAPETLTTSFKRGGLRAQAGFLTKHYAGIATLAAAFAGHAVRGNRRAQHQRNGP